MNHYTVILSNGKRGFGFTPADALSDVMGGSQAKISAFASAVHQYSYIPAGEDAEKAEFVANNGLSAGWIEKRFFRS